MEQIHLGLSLEGTHVLVTGGAGMIGSAVVSAFLSAGSKVSVLDINQVAIDRLTAGLHQHQYPEPAAFFCYRTDISDEGQIENTFSAAITTFGPIQTCVALASLDLSVLPHPGSIIDMQFEQWQRTFNVNVHGTFLTAREWLRHVDSWRSGVADGMTQMAEYQMKNVGLIIVGSESGLFGERGNPDYATGKSAVQGGLLQSLKADVPRIWKRARVNAVAPGPVNTPLFRQECERDRKQMYMDAQGTVALGRPVSMASVARTIVFLASENWSGDVHGQVISVDGGKMGKIMWTEDEASRMGETAL